MGSVWLFLVLLVLDIPSESHWKNLPGAPNQCEINGHCLQSPNFPQNYGPYEGCLVRLPPFSVILVMAFSTEKRDMLVINGNGYGGDDDSMINRSFVIRPETDVISWVTDGSGSRSGWQLCLDTPPACSDGLLVPVTGEDCPSSIENLLSCEAAALGALCVGDGKCHTRMDIDNCGQADIYRKIKSKSNRTTFPYDPIPVLVGSAPRPSLAESRWRSRRRTMGARPRPPSYHRRRFASDDTEDGDGTSLSTSTSTIPLWWTNETVWEKADNVTCQVNGPCLESPNFPGRYNNSERCVAVMPAFSAVTVTAFSTEWRYDFLIINQQRYSGTSRDIENKTFVIRPNSTNISWFPDAHDSLSGWQLCLDTPPACSDGFPVVPVTGEDCPSSIENLSSCETAALGALCIGDGKCHTRMDIDNCGQADIYRKMRSKSSGTSFPYDPIPVLVGSAPRPSLAESRRRSSRRRRIYSGGEGERRRMSTLPPPMMAPPAPAGPTTCSDGLMLIPVLQEECPEDMANLSSCEATFAGALCIGNGTCGTQDINNCGTFSVYRKQQLQNSLRTTRKPKRVEDIEDGLSILEVTYAVCGVVVVLICILVTMRCSQRKKAMPQGVAAGPVDALGVALPADFPGSWLMEWPDGQQVLTSISSDGRFEVERQTYDLTYLQCNTPARLRCQGETLELIRCTDNVWIWRASQSEKTFCWMKIRPVAHSLSMDFSKESVTFVCTSCQRPIEEACFWNYRPCESDEETYLCRDCSGDSDELQRKSVRGISARYLLDIFPDLARNGTEKADPNFYEIAPVLAMGSKGLGFQKVCPRDGQPGCSIVDAVDPCYQGLVTHFVSWCWAYKLNDFVSAIAVWAQKEEQDIDCIFLWICFFCNNQYRILESKCQTGSEQLRSVFEGHLAQAGQMLLMLDTFVKPSYMTRAWCIFEAFVCIDKDFPMTIILPERAEAAFIENLDMAGGFTLLKTAFETMDVRRARASSTADEDMIKKLVFTTSGFDVVNKAVKRRLLSWLTDQFQHYVDAAAEAIISQRSEGSQQTGLTHL